MSAENNFMVPKEKEEVVDFITEIKNEMDRLKAENETLRHHSVENVRIKKQLAEIVEGIKNAKAH